MLTAELAALPAALTAELRELAALVKALAELLLADMGSLVTVSVTVTVLPESAIVVSTAPA